MSLQNVTLQHVCASYLEYLPKHYVKSLLARAQLLSGNKKNKEEQTTFTRKGAIANT